MSEPEFKKSNANSKAILFLLYQAAIPPAETFIILKLKITIPQFNLQKDHLT